MIQVVVQKFASESLVVAVTLFEGFHVKHKWLVRVSTEVKCDRMEGVCTNRGKPSMLKEMTIGIAKKGMYFSVFSEENAAVSLAIHFCELFAVARIHNAEANRISFRKITVICDTNTFCRISTEEKTIIAMEAEGMRVPAGQEAIHVEPTSGDAYANTGLLRLTHYVCSEQ